MRGGDGFYFNANGFFQMRKIIFLLLILCAPRAAFAQRETKICALTLRDAPAFFGLRLQMSPAEVKTVFGKSLKLKIKREGTFFQNFIDKKPPAFLPGVRALYLRFFDGKLYQIEIFYDRANRETAQINSPTDLVNRLSANFNLPGIAAWTAKDARFYKLTCDGFSLAADNVLNARVELTDEAARALFEDAQKRKKKN